MDILIMLTVAIAVYLCIIAIGAIFMPLFAYIEERIFFMRNPLNLNERHGLKWFYKEFFKKN